MHTSMKDVPKAHPIEQERCIMRGMHMGRLSAHRIGHVMKHSMDIHRSLPWQHGMRMLPEISVYAALFVRGRA